MADESIGTARIDIVVGTDQMDVAIERAKSRFTSMSSEAQKAYAGMNAAEKRRIDSLIKQADTIGFTRQQQILYNAALKGTPVAILDDLKAKMGGVSTATAQAATAATKAFSGTNKSAKELQFAMRGLPAQFTDIFTSLASGQRPMMVLLQQGGQVKDMFGGIAPALRAVGSGILAMINPLTIGVAAAAALAFAWKSGSDEAVAYNKALITTGNYAGITAGRMNDMAAAIGGAVGTQHEAAKALAEVAASGKFTGEQIQLVGKAALEMSRMTGQATSETIKQFESLQDKPLEAILKLNDAQHFLTTAIYEQIKALEDQGRTQDAANLATDTYAATVDKRAKESVQNLGLVEKAWRGIKDATLEAGSAIAGIGRDQTDRMKFEALAAQRDRLIEAQSKGAKFDLNSGRDIQSMIDDATKKMASLQDKLIAAQKEASKKAIAAQATQALIDSDAEAAIYATKEEKRVKEVLAAHNKANAEVEKALAAGDKASAERIRANEAKIVAGIEAKYADKTTGAKTARTKDPLDFRNKDMAQIRAEIEAEGKLMDQRQRGAAAVAAYKVTLDDMLQTRQATIDLQVASVGMGQHEIDQMRALIAIDTDYNKKKADLQKRQQSTSDALEKNFYAQQLADLEAYHDKRVQMEKDGARRADEARLSFSAGASAALKDFEYNAGNVAGQTYDLFTNAFDGMADSIAKFVTTGKGNFSDLVASFIADMVKMEARVLASQLLTSLFGGMGTAAGYNSASPSQQVAFDVAHGSANGNVFNSPNLSAYSNTIVDKPTFFAKGGNVMGEAGPEAIMPLRRGADGKLGVAASGGGGDVQVEINITNQGQPVQAQQTGQRMDGKKLIIDMAIQAVANDMAKGGPTAQAAQQRFGLQRRGIPVGG